MEQLSNMKERLHNLSNWLRRFSRVASIGFVLVVPPVYLGWLPEIFGYAAVTVLVVAVFLSLIVAALRYLLGYS
jgi:hypothetical protein